MVRFPCPACGMKLTMHDKLAGKPNPCPCCNSTIQVPDKKSTGPVVLKLILLPILLIAGLAGAVIIEQAFKKPPEQIPTLKGYHRDAAIKALHDAGFQTPHYFELEDNIIFTHVVVPDEFMDLFQYDPQKAGHDGILAVRNAIYVFPDANPDWDYVFVVNGPPPGPDLTNVYGACFLFGHSGKISWEPAVY